MNVSIILFALSFLLFAFNYIRSEIRFRRFTKYWQKEPEGYSKWSEEQRQEYINNSLK